MRKPRLTRPTTELFERDGSMLDVNDLHRRGAFARAMWFPFRRLKTFPDRAELSFPDRNHPPQVILIERTGLHLGGARPWFVCACGRRCGKLYLTTVDARCRTCSDLQFASQRQWHTTRLKAKAEKIRSRIWFENGKPARPYYMHRDTYRRHMHALQTVEHAIRTGARCSSIRYRRQRERDADGRYFADERRNYADEQHDTEMI